MLTSHPSLTLTRELRVRLIDISESGCLLELARHMEVGLVGTLQLQLGTGEFRDDFEVVRCQVAERERSLYRIAVRFLWTTPRHAGSIRQAVAHHLAELKQADAAWVM